MNILDDLEEMILHLGGKCILCLKPYPDSKTWTIHHRVYRKGEKTYKDFKEKIKHKVTRGKNKGKIKNKTIYHKEEYLKYLKPIVLSMTLKEFAPMHHYCHVSLGYGTKWGKKNGNRQRFCDLIMELD